MRIDSNQSGHTPPPNNRPATRAQTANSGSSPAGGGLSVSEDQVQHSGIHVLVRALAAEAAQLPDVRQEKVSALRQAVQNGDYRPDPDQVAGALFWHLGASGLGTLGEGDCRPNRDWANQDWPAAI